MPLELYEHPDSPNCHKVRLLLSALELPYTRHRVELLAGETKSAAFRALNPRGQIPVLVDGELVLPESNAILVYLADRYAPLRSGASVALRAEVLRWLFWQASGASRTIAAVGYQRRVRPWLGQPSDEAAVARALSAFQREAEVLELHLERAPWLVGDGWTVAEIGVGAWLELAEDCGMLLNLPHSTTWLSRLRAEPFWTRAAGYELLGPRRVQRDASARISSADH